MKIPKSGGAPTTLASSQASPWRVVVDDTSVYWTNTGGGGSLKSVPKSGGTVSTLLSGLPVVDLVLDATHVYAVANKEMFGNDKTVMSVPKSGGAVTYLVTDGPPEAAASADWVTISGNTLFYSENHQLKYVNTDGSAFACSFCTSWLGQGAPTPDPTFFGAFPIGWSGAFAIDDQAAYFGALGILSYPGVFAVDRASGLGTYLKRDQTNAGYDPTRIVASDVSVYAAYGGGGPLFGIWRIAKCDGAAAQVVGGKAQPKGLAVDDQYVYWTDTGMVGKALR